MVWRFAKIAWYRELTAGTRQCNKLDIIVLKTMGLGRRDFI